MRQSFLDRAIDLRAYPNSTFATRDWGRSSVVYQWVDCDRYTVSRWYDRLGDVYSAF